MLSAFDKMCLVVGKIVVYFVTFLSCFYLLELLCTSIRPYVDKILEWLIIYRSAIVIGCFLCVIVTYLVLLLINKSSDESDLRRGRRKEV